tara:strand:- start:3 stop:158 length:156 start_codon:yes stop_codon:yes gene_type:complete
MYIYIYKIIRQFPQKSLANEGIIGDHIEGLLRIFLIRPQNFIHKQNTENEK